MRICQLPNFEKDLHSGDINFSTLQGSNLEEVILSIETTLEGVPFSVSLDSSTDVDNYLSSIKSLIDTILEELGKKELPFSLNRSAKAQIRKHFEGKFLPKPLTPVEQNILAVIAGTDLITEDERRSLRLSQTLREVYEDNDAINTFRLSQFDEEMRIRTIIDVASRLIIDNPTDLNRGIIKYQSQQFKIIRDYLVLNGFDTKLLPQSLYREDSATQVPNLVRTYTNALQMMYNLIESKKANGTFSAELEEGWASAITGKGDSSLYNAVNAYVNLAYFDDILKECFGDYIKINQNFDQPITVTSNDGISSITYKYSFEKGNANATKTWGVLEHDSLKEMSKFQQVLIKSIPIYDYVTRSIEYGRLQPKDFVGSFSKLMDVGAQVVGDLEFIQAINTFQDHPTTSLDIIFKRLFENRNNKTLLNSLEDLGLDLNNINYLYSVYRTVFKGKDSWKNIEDDYIKDRGLTSRYFLVDTLLGVVDSNVSMNYVNTTFNHDTGEAETSVKARYSANRTKFDIINNVNSTTIDRENKGELLSRFEISTQNKKDYTITLNNSETPRTFTIIADKTAGLLDKGEYSRTLTINGILDLTKVDIASKDNRDKLISRQGLTQDEETLMSVLDFIDTMLGTYFSRDVDGLRELNLLLRVKKDNLREMFASASRALLVTDLYNKFDNALNSRGEKYSKTELLTFLSEKREYADKIQDYNDKRKKEYFIKRFDGYQLSSLRGNQRWIDDLAKVRAILSGDTSKSVIANLDGDKIPNFGPGFLGARIEQQLTRSNNLGLATSNLLFVQNPTAIKAKVVNTDAITKDGLKKLVKSMTQGELLYDAIINKFVVPYTKNKSVFTQPTTFSDKTKFILYQVSLETLGLDDISGANFNEKVERLIISTIGLAYKEVYEHVMQDYMQIFPEFVDSMNGELNIDAVQNWLKTHKEKDFTAKALAAGVTVYKDVHYRLIVGKNLSVNELLFEYALNLYTPENLHNRLEFEKVNFINDLLSNRLSFEISLNDSGELDYVNGNDITKFLKNMLGSSVGKSWVKGNKMVLAKIRSKNGRVRNVTYGKISLAPDETFIINPVLNAFFMLDNLIGNNLRYSLTGSEINHKVKALAKLDLGTKGMNLYKDFIKKYSPNFDGNVITFYDAMAALRGFELRGEESDRIAAQAVRKVYNEQIYKIENGAQNAQFKRNVIIPGTMRYYLQGRLNGIRDKMKVAVINDMGANVFNFDGKADEIDAHDGSAFVNPFSSILENWSLQDCEVGSVKKPIQHWYDDRYMSATLLKYAVDTITNRWMLLAEGNDPRGKHHGVVLRNVFKKMTNVRWHNPDGTWKFGPIDLIEGCDYRSNPKIDFFKNILEGKSLYYRDGLQHKKVSNFGVENGIYFTIEQDVDSMGLEPTNQQKIYHYFTNSGEHIRSTEILEETLDRHTIDSLFELHTALGGIYSESIDDEGNLLFSEASNYAVAQFINNVATLKEGADPNNLTQDSYYQPLKLAMIDVLANNSAVKNGAGNMNPTSSFYDDTDFSYIEIGTNGYGIQMDADHTADEGHMTEFSQVISSLDAGGRLHGYVSQIYETLGKLAIDLSQIELDSIENFRETGNLSQVYDIVGRTIMNNLSKNRGLAGLANAIIDNIKKKFNLNTDHALDEFKIPFSDPNIYSTILSTFVSVINKKSIKRLYPGLGTVMVPGYNISMIYDVDGKTYQYEDLIRMAINAGFTSDFTDLSMKNRDIVQKFLQSKLNELPIYTNQEIFQPTDNVRITYTQDLLNSGHAVIYGHPGIGKTYAIEGEYKDRFIDWDVEYNEKRDKWIEEHSGTKKGTAEYKAARNEYLINPERHSDYIEFLTKEWNRVKNKAKKEGKILLASPHTLLKLFSSDFDYIINVEDSDFISRNMSRGGTEQNSRLWKEGINLTLLLFSNIPTYTMLEGEYLTDLLSGRNSITTTKTIEVSLDSIEDYYLFKDDIVAFLNGKGIVNPTNITYQKNITVPRNLAPVKISWEYDDETGHHTMNIFDHWAIKGSYHGKRDVAAIQKAFDDLQNGIYIDENGVEHQVQNLQNTAAELIMSNLYKSKFGLRNGDTLSDVIDQGVNYFKRPVTPIMSDSYDLVYTKLDNRNLYITFKPLHDNDENFDSTKRAWKNKIKKEFTYPPEYKGERTIINRVYTATNDNIPLFEVGREILRKDVQYDTTKKKFVDKDGKVLPNQSRFTRLGEDQVIEYIEFISNNLVTEIREKTSKYDLYNINRDQIKKVLLQMEYTKDLLTRTDKTTGETYTITPEQKFDEEINSFISHLLADVYHTRDFNGMLVNQEVSIASAYILRSSLYQLGEQLKYDADLSSYIKEGLYGVVKSGKAEDGVVKYSSRVRNRILNQYHEKLAQKQYTSFMKSQEFTVSRIPAQTLQSFMQMRNVGFTGTPTNQCFVSHWLTWLQGSDYDIDKAYIMGLSFDGNGRYVGWSNLFDYSSLETIKASEYLPMPKKKVYEVTSTGANIDSFIVNILGTTDAVTRINGYVELLNYLNDNNITLITYTIPEGAEVVLAIRTHEFTKVPYSLQEEASKNFISSHILNTVQNLRNMIGAYSPIEMEAFRAASEKSPKGEQASKMTLLNPSTKLLMLYQNITGKNVIGIAANGEKASFMWHYYINDIVLKTNIDSKFIQKLFDRVIDDFNKTSSIVYEHINILRYISDSIYREKVLEAYSSITELLKPLKDLEPYIEKVKRSLFSFTTTRLQGRDSGNIQPQEVNTLPDVNFEGVNPELMAKYGIQLSGDITVDLMISLVLSAATDNAKELILAKVNAGSKLAKMYLFLITLGYNINDIVSFMTSPVVTFIDTITEANIFTGQDLSIQDAIKVARGDFDNYYKSFLSTRTLGLLSKEDKNKLKRGELIENNFSEGSKEYIELTNALDAIAEVKDLLEQIIDLASEGKESIREEIVNNIPLDIDEFENILEGANEFSNLGKILGLNLGLPTSKALLQKRIQDMQKILSDRIKAVNAENQRRAKTEKGFEYEEIEDIPLDVKRYLTDAEYAQSIKDLYESVKKCINIFDIIDHIPQFNSIFKIFSAVLDIDHNISIKTRAYDSVYDLLKLERRYMSEQYQTRLLKGIDDAIIAKFVNNSGISIPYSKGTNMLNELRQVVETKEDGLLSFDSLSDVASFKYLFENSIVPNLKRGIVLDYLNGQVTQIVDEDLKSNKFIQSLIKGDHRGMPLYKCDLDMLTTENSQNSKIKFQDYIKGLQALLKIKINGIALSDLFVLYNLVVNKNQYGSDRMTTLFDQFIQNNGQLSLIRKYLNYVGDLDYFGKVEELNINVLDLMKAAAAVVNSEIGQKDPTIIVNTDSGPELRIKSGRQYVKWLEIVPQVPGETLDEYLNRIYNHNSYFVLGGSYSDAVDRQVQDLRVITALTLNTINNLIRQGALTIYKVCQ